MPLIKRFLLDRIFSNYNKSTTLNQKFHLSLLAERSEQNIRNDYESVKNFYNDVVPMIGLEVHAQLNIQSKLFSQGCSSSSRGLPNSRLDYFDIALPGTLPKLNQSAIRAAILSGLGLNCAIQENVHFDRKNYFYSDMPAGYQITQYNSPVARNGFIEFIVTTYHKPIIAHALRYDLVKHLYDQESEQASEFKPYIKRSCIRQIQLEQDSAKSLHEISSESRAANYSLVDYNRSGASLIEIVFEPDLNNHHEASSLVNELICILKALKTCDCELQEGSLRVDANVSIKSIANQVIESPSRVELKNLNSIKSLNRGIAHEIQRQADLIRNGEDVRQESRSFDTKTGKSVVLREKENAVDYRYVPEPSIPPLQIDRQLIDDVRGALPSDMPCNIRDNLMTKYGMDLELIADLMARPGLNDYFGEIMENKPDYDPNVVADFLIYTVESLNSIAELPLKVDLSSKDCEFRRKLCPDTMQELFDMLLQEEISYTTAFEVIKYIVVNNEKQSEPKRMVEEFGWYLINDEVKIRELCADLTKKMKNISKQYRRRGERRHMRMMLDKLCEITDNKVSVKKAMIILDEQLRSPMPKQDGS